MSLKRSLLLPTEVSRCWPELKSFLSYASDVESIQSVLPTFEEINASFIVVSSREDLFHYLQRYPQSHIIGTQLLVKAQTKLDSEADKTFQLSSLLDSVAQLFENVKICTTGFESQSKQVLNEIVYRMGGTFNGAFTPTVTHLIENESSGQGSSKHRAAVANHRTITTPQWVVDCYLSGTLLCHKDYRVPIFKHMSISCTGFDSKYREYFKRIIAQLGGHYSEGIGSKCSVLIANTDTNDKFKYALQWKIPIVTAHWFTAFVAKQGCVRTESYLYRSAEVETDDVDVSKATNGGMDIDIDIDDSTSHFLDGCVVSLLSVDPRMELNLQRMIINAGGTRLSYFHEMVTHIVTTSTFEELRSHYPTLVRRRVILSFEWLLQSYKQQTLLETAPFVLGLNTNSDVTENAKQTGNKRRLELSKLRTSKQT